MSPLLSNVVLNNVDRELERRGLRFVRYADDCNIYVRSARAGQVYLTRWVRLRLRAALWRNWRTPCRRRAALLALGVRPQLAAHTAGSGLGPWYLARAKTLSVGLSNAYFD